MVLGGYWWFLVLLGASWWFLVVLGGSCRAVLPGLLQLCSSSSRPVFSHGRHDPILWRAPGLGAPQPYTRESLRLAPGLSSSDDFLAEDNFLCKGDVGNAIVNT